MSNKIEKIVRHYVTKALTEVARDLDKLIEEKVRIKVEQRLQLADLLNEQAPPQPQPVRVDPQSIRQVFETPRPQAPSAPEPAPSRRKLTAEDLGITEDTWKSVYADTVASDNPILSEEHVPQPGERPSADKPELVSEAAMARFGFNQDFSKHMDAFAEMDKKNRPTQEDAEAQAEYRKALMKVNRNV